MIRVGKGVVSMTIHQRIHDLRVKRGMSQEELARRTGYKGKSSISKIEKGQGDLSQSQIVSFAKALRTTPMYLLDGVGTPEPTIDIEVVKKIESLDDYDIARLSAYVDGLLDAEKYSKKGESDTA